LSSWIPSVQLNKKTRPMMITYNSNKEIGLEAGRITNYGAHPHLTTINLIIGALLRFVQGHNGRFYCASYTTPGNGHDMSFLSGLAIANAIGAQYPFQGHHNCWTDFSKLSALMGL